MNKTHLLRIRRATKEFFSGLWYRYYDYWYFFVLLLGIPVCVLLVINYPFLASIATSISAVIILAMLFDRLYFSKPSLEIRFLIPHKMKEKVDYTDSSGRAQSEMTDEKVDEHIKINPGAKKKIFFCMENKGRAFKGLHIWINPQDWASEKFHIHKYDKKKYRGIEWSKQFEYQKWHNVAYFGIPNDYLVHGNVMVFPLLVDIKNKGKHPWDVEVSAGNVSRGCKKKLIVEVM